MNLDNKPHPESAAPTVADSDEIDLRQLFNALFDHKRFIAAITALFAILGLVYALLATPKYESNALLQIQSSGMGAMGGLSSMLGDASAFIDVKTDATAEMEILKSRRIAAKAVDALSLNIIAKPKYFPLFGKRIASFSEGLSQPGLFGLGGYVWGKESIHVSQFNLPRERLESKFILTALGDNTFELYDSFADLSFKGRVGETLALQFEGPGNYSVRVDTLFAKPGAKFKLIARSRLQEIENLQRELKVKEQGKLSGVIKVAIEGEEPQEILDILNVVTQEYLQENVKRKTEAAENNLEVLGEQLPALKKELQTAEDRYNKFRNARGVVNLGEEASALLQAATATQINLSELKQKRLELGVSYMPQHPSIQAADAMLQQVQKESEAINSQIRRLPSLEQESLSLTREMRVTAGVYAGLLQTQEQFKLAKGSKTGNARLIDAAFLPEEPVAPKRIMVFVLSILLGLFAGIAMVLLRRATHGTIESVEQVEQMTGLSVFASVPHSEEQDQITSQFKAKGSAAILAQAHGNTPSVENLRSFLTVMQHITRTAKNNLILITGPTPEVGNSFISINFATLLAASGKRVLLIDGDLRKGCLHQYLSLKQDNGFAELLVGALSFEKAIRSQVKPNLDFIACGAYPSNPTDLLHHINRSDILTRAAGSYDYIVIDAAPVLPVTDAIVLAAHAGSTIMVVREGFSATDEVVSAQKRLIQAGVAIAGLILNDSMTRNTGFASGNGAPESKKTSLWQRLLK